MIDDKDPACAACGMVKPPGGLKLGPEGGAEYDWFCKRNLACVERIAAQVRREKALHPAVIIKSTTNKEQ